MAPSPMQRPKAIRPPDRRGTDPPGRRRSVRRAGAAASRGRAESLRAWDTAPRAHRERRRRWPVPRLAPELRLRAAPASANAPAARPEWSYRLDLDRKHRRQVADDRRPRISRVGGGVHLAARRAEVDAAFVEGID